MRRSIRILAVFTLSLLTARVTLAQTPSAAGHWEGAIHAPFGNVAVAVDIAAEDGVLRGRFSNPSEQINGLPFARVSMDGRSIELQLKMGTESQAFKGTLSSDGRAMSGDFLISVFGVPFDLTRTGDAKFEAAPTSPVLAKIFEGTWRGDLSVGGDTHSMVLTLANRDAQTSAGSWGVNDGVQIPITIVVGGSHVTIASPVTRETFNGTIDAEGGQIAGTFAEGDRQVPLTLRKAR
jgi:hypothetical protein